MFGGLKRVWMTEVTDTGWGSNGWSLNLNGWSGKSLISQLKLCMIWSELIFTLSPRLKSLTFLGLKNQNPKDSLNKLFKFWFLKVSNILSFNKNQNLKVFRFQKSKSVNLLGFKNKNTFQVLKTTISKPFKNQKRWRLLRTCSSSITMTEIDWLLKSKQMLQLWYWYWFDHPPIQEMRIGRNIDIDLITYPQIHSDSILITRLQNATRWKLSEKLEGNENGKAAIVALQNYHKCDNSVCLKMNHHDPCFRTGLMNKSLWRIWGPLGSKEILLKSLKSINSN